MISGLPATAGSVKNTLPRRVEYSYQHCGKQHLHRYLAEFDFQYSNRIALGVDDTVRAARAVQGAVGKRLMYQRPASERGRVGRPASAATHAGERSVEAGIGCLNGVQRRQKAPLSV